MHARAAVFDVYGDHLSSRGDWAPVASLVRLLAAVDLRPQAVRTAVSRLTREGWLEPQPREGRRGYLATARARRRLAATGERIYGRPQTPWDGRWHLLVLPGPPGDRAARARLGSSLGFLGYARLASDTWVAPRRSGELESVTGAGPARSFHAEPESDPRELARVLWPLDDLAEDYTRFERWALDLVSTPPADDEQAFAVRSALVHEWRKFLFRDPGLPAEVLPDGWSGHRAARCFDRLATELRPSAGRFVDRCLDLRGEP